MGITWVICLLCLGTAWAENWELVWEDEFDFIDTSKWQHEITASGGGNGEFQVYTNQEENSYTQDGKLFIKPILTKNSINPITGEAFGEDYLWNGVMNITELYGSCTNDDNWGCYRKGQDGIIPTITSARLRSYDKFSFCYGKAEIIAKMPAGDYLWPAIWMLPEDWVYGSWPLSGEIDINEGRGNRDLKSSDGESIGADHAAATLHWGLAWNQNRYYLTTGGKTDDTNNYVDSFHNYTLVWSANGIQVIIDGDEILTVNRDPNGFYGLGWPWDWDWNPWWSPENNQDYYMAPFDQEFHFILNVAVGGKNGYFPDDAVNTVNGEVVEKPYQNSDAYADINFWNNNELWLPTWVGDDVSMQVDSIKVYQAV